MGAAAILYGDQGSILLAITWTWAAIAIILYILRAVSAARQQSTNCLFSLRWDFIWVSLAFIATLTAQITTTISLERARDSDQGLDTIADVIYTGLVANCAAIFGMIFGRFAVVALLLELHGPTYPKGKIVLWGIGISQCIFSIVQAAFTINQCNPISRLWHISAPGTCGLITINRKLGFFTGSYGAFCDIFLAGYPALLIIGPLQQMKRKLKICICVIMAGGMVAGVAGIVKTVMLADIVYVSSNYATIVKWIMTETWFIIIFGSITTTRPIFVAMGRHIKLFSSDVINTSRRADQSEAIEFSGSRQTTGGTVSKQPVSKSRLEHAISEDEIALHESYTGCRPYNESPA